MSLNIVNPFVKFGAGGGGGSGDPMFWQILARGSGSANDYDSGTFTAKENLLVLCADVDGSGNNSHTLRMGTGGSIDTGKNYNSRYARDGGSDGTYEWNEIVGQVPPNGSKCGAFEMYFIENNAITGSNWEKYINGFGVNSNGSTSVGTYPRRAVLDGKWSNTSDCNIVGIHNDDSGSMSSASEILVLGYDSGDTSGDDMTELGTTVLTGGADSIDLTLDASKKWMFVQAYLIADGNIRTDMTFNNSTGTAYARRRSNDGAADSTAVNETTIDVLGDEDKDKFIEMWVCNDHDNVDNAFVIGNIATNNADGSDNPPSRCTFVAKYDNGGNAITSIKITNTGAAGDYATGSSLSAWGVS